MTAVPNLRNWRTHSAHTHGATRKACGQVREGFHFTGNPSQFGRSCSVVTWLLLFCSRYGFGATGPFCAHAQRDVASYLSGAHLDPTRRKFSDGSGENLFFSFFFSPLCAMTKSFLGVQERGSRISGGSRMWICGLYLNSLTGTSKVDL